MAASTLLATAANKMRTRLVTDAYVEFSLGLPKEWREWAIFSFVELYYDRFHSLVVSELDALRDVWEPCKGSSQRHGAFAAMKVSERLAAYGIAVYSPGCSQEQQSPYRVTGPRWYVSITAAALRHFGVAPAPAPELHEVICGHPSDRNDPLRARGLGWTLAPAGSDPQALHADIWGVGAHQRKGDRTRWPHILWKRDASECCTTQIVSGGFTEGDSTDDCFSRIRQVRAPAIVADSEALHRGASTAPAAAGALPTAGWASTLSLELCTPSGWAAWEAYATAGTTKEDTSDGDTSTLDWRMLEFAMVGSPESQVGCARSTVGLPTFDGPAHLPPAPWAGRIQRKMLYEEQRKWELST